MYLFMAGTLPTEWGQMSLSTLSLSFNELTGDLDKTDVYRRKLFSLYVKPTYYCHHFSTVSSWQSVPAKFAVGTRISKGLPDLRGSLNLLPFKSSFYRALLLAQVVPSMALMPDLLRGWQAELA